MSTSISLERFLCVAGKSNKGNGTNWKILKDFFFWVNITVKDFRSISCLIIND